MIEIPEKSDLIELEKMIAALQEHLKIKFVVVNTPSGMKYKAIPEEQE